MLTSLGRCSPLEERLGQDSPGSQPIVPVVAEPGPRSVTVCEVAQPSLPLGSLAGTMETKAL